MVTEALKVLIWNENIHEARDENVTRIYPDGIHNAIGAALTRLLPEVDVRTATLAERLVAPLGASPAQASGTWACSQ
jgi:trehalose utilization protein